MRFRKCELDVAQLLILACLSWFANASVSISSAVLSPDAVILSTASDNAIPAFRLALRDVRQDWYGVLSRRPILAIDQIPQPGSLLHSTSNILVFLGSCPSLRDSFGFSSSSLPTLAPEQHICRTLPYNSTGNFYPLVCCGQDTLGSVYATYAFSQEILGIDPQAYWVDKKPQKLPPPATIFGLDHFSYDSGVPTWRNRGFFINDEDQLGGWAMDPNGAKVFTLQAWDMVYQTLLRLKGNSIIIGTSAFPDEESFDLCQRRGLSFSQHHVTILGTAMFAWPDGLPYDYPFNPEVPVDAWKRNVQYAHDKGRKVAWTLGYRGKNDYPFWYDVPSFNTSKSRGALISQAIITQKKIVEDIFGPDDPQFFAGYLWSELLDLYAGGWLTFPPDVHIVHADNGAGQIYRPDLVAAGHGVYYHVAMMSNQQNQLTELCSPERMYTELKTFVKKNATSYFIINLSDLRAVPLSTQAVMEFGWNSDAFLKVSPRVAQHSFIAKWASKTYEIPANSSLCSDLVNIYTLYFDVPYMAGKSGNSIPLGEHHLCTAARNQAQALTSWVFSKNSTFPQSLLNQSKSELGLITSSVAPLESLQRLADSTKAKIPPPRASFFNAHVIVQIGIHLWGARADILISQAVALLSTGSTAPALTKLRESRDCVDEVIRAMQAGEDGKWQNWFMWDQIVDWFSLRDDIGNAILSLTSVQSSAQLPPSRTHFSGTGPWSQEFQYEYLTSTYFPFFYRSSGFMQSSVTVLCDPRSSSCQLSPIGIKFSGGWCWVVLNTVGRNQVGIDVNEAENSIHYTMDGTLPTTQSPKWDPTYPIKLTSTWANGNITLNAALFDTTGRILGPVTKAVVVHLK